MTVPIVPGATHPALDSSVSMCMARANRSLTRTTTSPKVRLRPSLSIFHRHFVPVFQAESLGIGRSHVDVPFGRDNPLCQLDLPLRPD